MATNGARFRRNCSEAKRSYVWAAMIYALRNDTRMRARFCTLGRLKSSI